MCTPSPLATAFTNAFVLIGGAMKDFCDYSRQHLPAPKGMSMSTSPLGSYDSCNSIAYVSTPPSSLDRQAISLGRLVSSVRTQSYMGRFPQYQRLDLAEILALAVLQYHASSWLKRSWRSEDIHFSCIDENGPKREPRRFESPHLNVRVSGPNAPVSRALAFPPHKVRYRVTVFFSLGVVLLEIAYCATLEILQRSTDLDNGEEDRYTEFFLGRWLAKSECSGIGVEYDKIVERLVECDFGCGCDLDKAPLQVAFYDTVIYPLERLEKTLHDFHLGK